MTFEPLDENRENSPAKPFNDETLKSSPHQDQSENEVLMDLVQKGQHFSITADSFKLRQAIPINENTLIACGQGGLIFLKQDSEGKWRPAAELFEGSQKLHAVRLSRNSFATVEDDGCLTAWRFNDSEIVPYEISNNAFAYQRTERINHRMLVAGEDRKYSLFIKEGANWEETVLDYYYKPVAGIKRVNDSSFLAFNEDGRITKWCLGRDGATPLHFESGIDDLNSVSYLSNGLYLASGAGNEYYLLAPTSSNKKVQTVPNINAEPYIVQSNQDGLVFIAGANGKVSIVTQDTPGKLKVCNMQCSSQVISSEIISSRLIVAGTVDGKTHFFSRISLYEWDKAAMQSFASPTTSIQKSDQQSITIGATDGSIRICPIIAA